MRTIAFEKWNQFSTVFPPAGIVAPRTVCVGSAASAHVLLRIGS
jgi:hypothetical protein